MTLRERLAELPVETWSGRRIAWIGGLFIAAIASLAGYDIVRSYEQTVDETRRELEVESRVIAEQTARSLQAVDVVLRHLVGQLQSGPLAKASPDELHAYLKDQAVGLVQADGLVVINPDGSLRAMSQLPPTEAPQANVAQRGPFLRSRDSQNAGLVIESPMLRPSNGQWVFPVLRRIVNRDGSFAGVAAAPGRVDYFQQFYGDAYPNPSTRIALLHRDGTLLARHPPNIESLGKRFPVLEGLLPSPGGMPVASRGISPIDGTDRFAAIRLVPDYPLVVVVTREASAALAPWRHQAIGSAARVSALGTLAALLIALVWRQIARLSAARASLAISEERYALAMTGSNEGHWLWDMPAKQIYVSAKLAELFGLKGGAQVMAENDYFFGMPLHPDDVERVHRNRNEHVAGLTPRLDHEFRIIDRDTGEVRWIHTRAQCFRDAEGRPMRLAGATVDATRRKHAEASLRESEERYALAMTGSRGGHWVWDVEADRLFVSSTAIELFGRKSEPYVGTRMGFLSQIEIHPDDRDRVMGLIEANAVATNGRVDYECRILLPDGSRRWILNRAQHFSGERIAGVVVDITERKHDEAERERLESQLRQAQKLEAIGTLAGGIAHDFNNILSAILGYGELAQKGAPEGSAQRRHVDAALAAGQRAKSLVERILAFSRTGMGERVPVHVQSVVEEALDVVAATLPPTVTLERRLAGGDAGILGDPTQIHQVVMNLCANAVQAMKHEGRIEVALRAARLTAPLTVTTSVLPAGDYVCLSIADSGSGIEPRLLERIFDPFFTTKEIGVGTGLGLSLVHGIVTDLGGGIDVQSRPGEGSRFTIHLPSHGVVAAPAQDAASPEPIPRGEGQVVLLVDDEEPLVRLGEELLAGLGYEPVGFVSSAAALDALREMPERFDVVLTDESMPGLTGSELALHARRLQPDLPIVMMSGFVSPALIQQARAAGVREVLSKPLAERDIARALAAALPQRMTEKEGRTST